MNAIAQLLNFVRQILGITNTARSTANSVRYEANSASKFIKQRKSRKAEKNASTQQDQPKENK